MVAHGVEQRLVHTAVAEAARRDLVYDAREWRALLVERHRVVHVLVAKVLDRGREVAEEDCAKIRRDEGQKIAGYAQTLLSPTSSAISMLAPSTVPNSRPPFKQNFMFDVPDASVPAVEICWLISDAGMRTSASETE